MTEDFDFFEEEEAEVTPKPQPIEETPKKEAKKPTEKPKPVKETPKEKPQPRKKPKKETKKTAEEIERVKELIYSLNSDQLRAYYFTVTGKTIPHKAGFKIPKMRKIILKEIFEIKI